MLYKLPNFSTRIGFIRTKSQLNPVWIWNSAFSHFLFWFDSWSSNINLPQKPIKMEFNFTQNISREKIMDYAIWSGSNTPKDSLFLTFFICFVLIIYAIKLKIKIFKTIF